MSTDHDLDVASDMHTVAVEVDFTAQMLTAWPEVLDRTREVASAHTVPEGHRVIEASHRIVRVATSLHTGLIVWNFHTIAPPEVD